MPNINLLFLFLLKIWSHISKDRCSNIMVLNVHFQVTALKYTQSIAWVCCISGNVWYNVVMLSSVVQCRLVSRVLNCCQCGLWCFQCFQRDLFSLVPSDANTFTLSSRNRIPAHNHLSTAQLSLHVEHNPRSGQLTTLLMIQIRIY